jgi:hypothetical protein
VKRRIQGLGEITCSSSNILIIMMSQMASSWSAWTRPSIAGTFVLGIDSLLTGLCLRATQLSIVFRGQTLKAAALYFHLAGPCEMADAKSVTRFQVLRNTKRLPYPMTGNDATLCWTN